MRETFMVQAANDPVGWRTKEYLRAWLVVVLLALSVSLVRVERSWGLALSPNNERPPGLAQPEPLIRTARDLLKLYGMDDKRLTGFLDREPIEGEQYDLLLRFLIAVRRFSLADQHRYAKSEPLGELLKSPQDRRGELIAVRGKILRVTAEKPEQQLAERFELPVFYRCDVEFDGAQSAVIYALDVPRAWREQTSGDQASTDPINERIGALAFFARQLIDGEKATPVLVTQRLAWHPNTMLGDAGGDAGLFETVENNTPMQASDSPCFYDMLAACDRVLTGQLLRSAAPDFKVSTLFPRRDKKTKKIIDPPTPRGELIALSGTAQRAVRVQIEDPDTIAAYGFDHYYEIELWHGDAQGNPIVFCMRKIPKDMQIGERIAVDITVAGFFFKTWAYRVNRASDELVDEKTRFQIAPLLIGREPVLMPREPEAPWAQAIAGGLFAVAVVGAWIGMAWSQREDKRFHDRVVRRVVIGGDEQLSLDGLASLDHSPREFHDYAAESPLLPRNSADDLPQIDMGSDHRSASDSAGETA